MKEIIANCPKWISDKLNILQATGFPIYLCGESVAAILFGGRFGPMNEPLTTEFLSPNIESNLLINKLNMLVPTIVWKPFIRRELGGLEDIFITMDDGYPTIKFPSTHIKNSLEQGIINCEGTTIEILKLAKNFPALIINNINPAQILTSQYEIARENQERLILKNFNMTPKVCFPEIHLREINTILEWHKNNPAQMEWIPAPSFGSNPSSNPWIDKDLPFRYWLLQQAEYAYQGNDIEIDLNIQKIIDLQLTEQKGTHQGWKTWQHSLNSTIRLETDHLPEQFRKPIRMAMLMHDIGKTNTRTVWTAGCHAAYGAKIWQKAKLNVTNQEETLISFIIKNHDILGSLDKTIKNPNLSSGISIEEVVLRIKDNPIGNSTLALKIIHSINDADIGSLSTLRYLLKLTPLLIKLVEAGLNSHTR
ncbi:HD domain-containing protein [Dyadobacter frigoris]|uniref:HD domain-containing protein n=1 Tax=Dyadobacter frigoris TaxID=2576211 RepID=A0A4V6BJS6_9BACT|nr:HD domain-containing protein [Dyadobacter frigoris]TKT93313.1 hypothetical protein FDK13_05530 [Dyadobacter frigoris]